MRRLTTWGHWPGEHPAVGLDLFRVFLGIALFARGVLFIQRPEIVLSYIHGTGGWFWPLMIAQYVGLAHLGGGALLVLGLFTRFAALAQIPVLVGAVFFVHAGEGLFTTGESLQLAVMVLFSLSVFAVFGAGPLSLDARFGRTRGDTSLWAAPRKPARA